MIYYIIIFCCNFKVHNEYYNHLVLLNNIQFDILMYILQLIRQLFVFPLYFQEPNILTLCLTDQLLDCLSRTLVHKSPEELLLKACMKLSSGIYITQFSYFNAVMFLFILFPSICVSLKDNDN